MNKLHEIDSLSHTRTLCRTAIGLISEIHQISIFSYELDAMLLKSIHDQLVGQKTQLENRMGKLFEEGYNERMGRNS